MQMTNLTLTDRVAQALMQRIADGTYPVGTKLPSGKLLAGEFSVSAAVIREATERLRTKGLVRTRQGAGCMVLTRDLHDGFQLPVPETVDRDALRHIYELRFEIEGGAAALAAIRATKEDVSGMRHILASLEKSLHDPEQALEWDVGFHRAIADATHNPHYRELLSYLTRQWRESVRVARSHTLLAEQAARLGMAQEGDAALKAGATLSRQVHAEHEQVLDAIEQGDASLARACAQAHLRQASERLGLDTRAFGPHKDTVNKA
ncbi:GntR family transcriptional regulator [Advenella kashmirensis W13003]|uniref:GntR family transcriptional regulator n=2 Tax=Advenella kashmirensis TaxID=310575 RepID=V8QQ78_9BURK|nr:GntR family transcriptional regulator [Advenella kashmirensis W13003]